MVKLVLPKNVGFARYRRFGVFGLHGHFDLILVFFRDLVLTYPPFSIVLNKMGAKKKFLIYHHSKDIQEFDFCNS
jgi:hypothetical protein